MIRLLQSQNLLRQALSLGVPVAIANLVVGATLLLELFIVGHEVGDVAVGAVTYAQYLILVLILAFHAPEIATQVLIARRYGERNYTAIGATLDNAILISVSLALLFTGGLLLAGPGIFKASEPAVRDMAYEYFRWRLPSVPLLAAILAMVGFLNAIGKAKVPAVIYGCVLTAHIILAYGLAGGHFGLPNMGVRGVGLAATASTLVGFVIFVAYLARPSMRGTYYLFHFARNLDAVVARGVVKLGLPIFIQQLVGNSTVYLFMRINANVDDGAVSLQVAGIAYQCANLSMLGGFGFGIAAASMAGQALGARKPEKAAFAIRMCWMLGAIYMTACGLLFATCGHWITQLFFSRVTGGEPITPERMQELVAMGSIVFVIMGVSQVFESGNTILAKSLQGVGLGKWVMTANIVTQYALWLPLAYLLALKLEFGGIGAWIAMSIYLAMNATIYLERFLRGDWKTIKL